jgi:hypothetical protein
MTAPNDGGPAFPLAHPAEAEKETGMSLRDWFAGQLVSGIALNCGDGCGGYMRQRAEVAYQLADAMLAARAKGAE